MEQIRLTKAVKNDDGLDCVACRLYNTDKCTISSCGSCQNCDMLVYMLNKLFILENALDTAI